MIQQDYRNAVEDQSAGITTTGFTIEANASVYAMLTQNVYNDPILAVIREWSTNACDACLAADKPVKYDVHIPNISEPQFFVRDYGTGLPPEDIVGLFSNLGASTKRGSNMFNGTLGIGRMAGLAVADAFTIESYYEGNCYSYVVSLKDGIPVTLHMGDVPTTELDGLKLGVAIEASDISYYQEKAADLYKYFDYKPNINDSSIDMEIDTSDQISDDWFTQRTTDRYNYDNYIIMSQVKYKIPRASSINTHDFKQLVLRAPPGSVTFNPGRESLSLDKKTTDYVNTAFDKVKKDYVTRSTTALAACENDRVLIETYYNIVKNAPSSVAKTINPTPFMSPELTKLVVLQYHSSRNVQNTAAFTLDTNDLLSLASKPSYYKTSKVLDTRNSMGLLPFFTAKHVIVDMKTKYKTAINNHYTDTDLIMWQRQSGSDIDDAVKEAKRYLTVMGIPYVLASAIVAAAPTTESSVLPREGFYASTIDLYREKAHQSMSMSNSDMLNGKYLYLKLHNTTPVLKDPTLTFPQYLKLYKFLQSVGTEVPRVKGVAKKYQGCIEDLPNWVDFETYIKDTLKTVKFRSTSDDVLEYMGIREKTAVLPTFPEPIQQYYQNLKAFREYCASDNYVSGNETKELATKLGATLDAFKPTYPVSKKEILQTFPLVFRHLFLNSHSYTYSEEELAHLIKIEESYALHSVKQ